MKLKVNTIYNGTMDISEYLITAKDFFKGYGYELEFSENPLWYHIALTIRPDIAGGSANIREKFSGAYKIRVGLLQDYLPSGQKIWRDVGQILIHEILHCLWAEMGLGDIHDKNFGAKDNVKVMEMVKATNRPDKIILHHSGSQTDTYESIKAYHISKGWGDVAYHFVITRDNKILIGRWEVKEGTHTIGQNDKSIGICTLGHFGQEKPTQGQINAIRTILGEYPNLQVKYHREFADTECPGDNLTAILNGDENKNMLKLVREKDGDGDVYAIGENNAPILILNAETFAHGSKSGMWGGWGDISEVDELPAGEGLVMILTKSD